MDELNDDELQELLSNAPVPDGVNFSQKEKSDFYAYQHLFKTLAAEPAQGLSFGFAANVRRKLQEQLNRKSDRRFNLLAVAIFTATLAVTYGLLTSISPATGTVILNIVLKFKWVMITITILFFCTLLIDQRLVKREY